MAYDTPNYLVWGELPVTDLDQAAAFYSAVIGAKMMIDENGPNPMAIFRPFSEEEGIAMHLYPGKPAPRGTGPTLHLAAEGTAEDIMKRVETAGGTVLSDPIPLPVGRFFYAEDLDGNSIGFYEAG
ncbi:MAG: VOC family protein [Rhodobacteraceae bacterium]|nr:VOC family protein [Paracoccaceae bacterium]